MKLLCFIEKVCNKIMVLYRKRLFAELTGNSVKTLKILGKLHLINKNVKIGKNVTFFEGVTIFGDGPVRIGDCVSIGQNTLIYASKKGGGITIGNNTQIAAQSYIIDVDHGIEKDVLIRNQDNTVAPICIGSDVWIAAGCKVLKGSVIHDGAVIGANSVVKGDIPENAIAVGSPARVKKYRGEK